jgi:hypothetical protein
MGSTDSSKASASIPEGVFPYVKQNLDAASALRTPRLTYNDSDKALTALGQRQLSSSGAMNSANDLYTAMLQGKYLDPMSNPNSQGMLTALNTNYNRGLSQGLEQINSQFGMAGQPSASGVGRGYAQRYANSALSDYQNNLSNMLGGMYNTERGYQNQALYSGNPVNTAATAANALANQERNLAQQQYGLDANQVQLLSQALASTPMGYTQYGPSEFQQNFGMGTQAAQLALLSAIAFSSRRWKTNIRPLEEGLQKVMRMRGVRFDWKKTGRKDIGFIAEEMGEIVPEVVVFEQDGKTAKMIDYSRVTTVLVEAIKEQQKQIQALTERVAKLAGATAAKIKSMEEKA